MLKSFHLTAVLSATWILFIAESTFSRPLTTGDKYPVVPKSDTNKLICYIQTADGRTLNLDSLCKNQFSIQSQKVTSDASAQSQLVVSDLRYEGNQMSARIVNNTGKTLHNAKVNFDIIGEDGSVIERGSIYTEPKTLSPGQTARINTFMPSGAKVRITYTE